MTPASLSKLRDDLVKLPPKEQKAFSAKHAVHSLLPELQAARVSGYTLADLADYLGKRGIAVSASTLGTYLRELSPPARAQQSR